jgi:hypothetical protein
VGVVCKTRDGWMVGSCGLGRGTILRRGCVRGEGRRGGEGRGKERGSKERYGWTHGFDGGRWRGRRKNGE